LPELANDALEDGGGYRRRRLGAIRPHRELEHARRLACKLGQLHHRRRVPLTSAGETGDTALDPAEGARIGEVLRG
jgi:hypothetical protein